MGAKKWEVKNKRQMAYSKWHIDDFINLLLENRGIKTRKEREEFLHPVLEHVTTESVGINKLKLTKAIKRIQKAIEKKEQIVVFGDYDVDGIAGCAILWETLHNLGANVLPYIPHRVDEGYGLSMRGIKNLELRIKHVKLIITVDNGIVANKAVDFANKQGIDVIITDHHVPGKKLPNAHAIVHTTKLCGTGVAYLLSKEISNFKFQISNYPIPDDHLGLVALATIADLVPLTGANRTLTKFGLEQLRKTKRIGLLELFKEAAIDQKTIDVYAIGHIIAPRLNAMGRLEYAMESLRLLCTNNKKRAEDLAMLLGSTNRERQLLTQDATAHALTRIKNYELRITNEKRKISSLIFIAGDYQPGIVGLVAGRLVEEFYRPSIVLSVGKTHSKASARSVAGFNIIEFIRSASDLLVDAGGHPMAAGFIVETSKLQLLQETLEKKILESLDESLLTRTLKIDCELPFAAINTALHSAIQSVSPFGMGNPEPTFVSKKVVVDDVRIIGREGKHLKFKFSKPSATSNQPSVSFDAVGFGIGERIKEFVIGKSIDIAYTIDENIWNGKTSLQLKIKDVKTSQ